MAPVTNVPVARAEGVPVWAQLSMVPEGLGLRCQLSGHATMKTEGKNTSILKAFYNSLRLQPRFGELDPVTANCCWANTATHYRRSSCY